MLSIDTQKIIEQLLIDQNLITPISLEQMRNQSAREGKSILALISDQNLVSEEDLTRVNAAANKVPYANLLAITADPKILTLIPRSLAQNYQAVAFGLIKNDRLAVGMLDPTNVQAVDFIARKTGRQIVTFMVSESSVGRLIGQYPADLSREVSAVIGNVDAAINELPKGTKKEKIQSAAAVQNLVQDAPITRALNTILDYAAQSGASDIHIEPHEKELKVRFRVDGVLQDTMTLPKPVEAALISRIKILSNLKIDEHRIPQDGKFKISAQGREIDLRIAIAPVVFGEQVVIRLLDKDGSILTLDALGFRGRALRVIEEGIRKPHGMTLSTGPTGSGKSTTLYAVISEIKDITINIVTLEDPVEYQMDGINQIQINADVGLTFASGLRSILRQDPNVVMVGEIRDKETADLAVQAALTGHVVLSTIHTNSASGVLPRLLDMDVEPFLVASTINTVIGQRLVRRICKKCKEEYESSPAETLLIKESIDNILPKSEADMEKAKEDLGYDILPFAGATSYTLFRGKGCSECTKGYKGRSGIYEVFGMSDSVEKLLVARASTSEIQTQAQKDGMVTMRQDGYLKALNGVTTTSEVARVAAEV